MTIRHLPSIGLDRFSSSILPIYALFSISFHHTLEFMKLKNPPTAILFFTQTASGILQALQQLNLSTPNDISLICYDDLEIAKTNNPPLTVKCPQASKAGER